MPRKIMYSINVTLILIPIILAVVFGFSFAVMIIMFFNVYIMIYVYARYKTMRWLTKSMMLLFLVALISFVLIEAAVIKEMNTTNTETITDVV